MADYFYLQDKRQYVGNCLLFWAQEGGYTTNVLKAKKFSREDAFNQHKCRPDIDIPIPCAYIKTLTAPTVDAQKVNVKKALRHRGLSLIETPKSKNPIYRCHSCGQFLKAEDYYYKCPNCQACNRP